MAEIDDRLLNVNQHGVLKIPTEIWLAMLFLLRYWVVSLFAVASILSNQSDALFLFGDTFSWAIFAAEGPCALAFWVCIHRSPEAAPWIRKLWPFARLLIASTALLHLLYLGWHLWTTAYWSRWPELFLASCSLIDITIVYALYASRYVATVFAEFPPAAKPGTAR